MLANVTDEIVIVCGMARGADRLGEQYAKERGYSVRYFLLTGTAKVVLLGCSAMKRWREMLMLWWPFGTGKAVAPST